MWHFTRRGAEYLLLVLLAGVVAVASKPSDARKFIIETYIAFETRGTVNRPGTQVTLTALTAPGEAESGDHVMYRVRVTQHHSGAWGELEQRIPFVPLNANRQSPRVRVRPGPGSVRFEPGDVEAAAEATHFAKDGRVLRSWHWVQRVELVEE